MEIINGYSEQLKNRRLRIFLSSTFSDMQEERDLLVKKTFPAIKRLCQRRNVDFSVVDLRWGVTEEEAHTGKVIEICMDEIERTRPFFIGLIGGRYGWMPSTSDLELNPRLVNRYPWVKDCVAQYMSITEMEIKYGVLKSEQPIHAHFFIRRARSTPSQYKEVKDSMRAQKLNRLKASIREYADQGRCKWTDYGSPKDLAKKVYRQLTALLDELYPDILSDPAAITRNMQEARIQQLRKVYRNQGMLDLLEQHVHAFETGSYLPIEEQEDFAQKPEKKWCIAVNGGRSSGKSALLANWRKGDPHVLRTFLDNQTNTAEKILDHLIDMMKASGFETTDKVIWIIDGLDCLSSEYDRSLDWLEDLGVNLIVSTNDDFWERCVYAMAERDKMIFEKVTMQAPTISEIIDISKIYLQQFAKGLSETQFIHIANQRLFTDIQLLLIFLDELIQFGVYEQLDEFMSNYLRASTAHELIEKVLDRFENDYGKNVMQQFFGMLCITKLGVPEKALQRQTGLNNIEWAALYISAEHFISTTNGFLQLNHQDLRELATSRYLGDRRLIHDWRNDLIVSYNIVLRQLLASRKWRKKILFRMFCWLTGLSKAMTLDEEYKRVYTIIETDIIHQKLLDGQGDQFLKQYSILQLISMMSGDNIIEVASFFEGLYKHQKKKVTKNFGYIDILISYWSNVTNEMTSAAFTFLGGDRETMNTVKQHISNMWLLPKKIKTNAIDAIDLVVGTNIDQMPIEETWEHTSLRELNSVKLVSFLDNSLPYIISEERIKHIEKKADQVLERIKIAEDNNDDDHTNDATCALFQCVKAMCLCRQGQIYMADSVFSSAVQKHAFVSKAMFRLNFLIGIGLCDRIRSNKCIQQALDAYQDGSPFVKLNAIRKAIYMQMTIAIFDYDKERFNDLLHQLVHLYEEHKDIPDWENCQYIAIDNCAYWLLAQKQNGYAARVFKVGASLQSLSMLHRIILYSMACQEFCKDSMYDDAIEAGNQALLFHKEMVERGESKPFPDYYLNLQNAYQKKHEYKLQRQVLQEAQDLYEQQQDHSNRLWTMQEIAYSYINEGTESVLRRDVCRLFKEGIELYEKLCQQSTLEKNGISYYIYRYNRDYHLANAVVFAGVDQIDKQRLQFIADDMTELKHLTEESQEIAAALGDVITPLCLCLVAAGRYEEMKPYIHQISVDLSNLYYIHTSESEEPVNNYINYQIELYMDIWNRNNPDHQMPLTLRNVAHWEHPQYEAFMIPRMEQIAQDEQSPIRTQVMASLMIHYYIMEQAEKLSALRDEASRLIHQNTLSEDQLYHLVLAMRLLSSDDADEPVDDDTMLQLLNEADPDYTEKRNAEYTIKAALLFLENHNWDDDGQHFTLMLQAIEAFGILGEKIDERCYHYILAYHENRCHWQDIEDNWNDIIKAGLDGLTDFQLFRAEALFYLCRYNEAISQCDQLLKRAREEADETEHGWADLLFYMTEYIQFLFRAGYTEKALVIQPVCEELKNGSHYLEYETELFYYWSAYIMADSGRHIEALQYLEKDLEQIGEDEILISHNKLVRVFCYIKQGNIRDALKQLSILPKPDDCEDCFLFNHIMVELALIQYYASQKNVSEIQLHNEILAILIERYDKLAGILQRRLQEKDLIINGLLQAKENK